MHLACGTAVLHKLQSLQVVTWLGEAHKWMLDLQSTQAVL